MDKVVERLDDLGFSEEQATKWLNTPHPDLKHQTPTEAINNNKVADVIYLLKLMRGQFSQFNEDDNY